MQSSTLSPVAPVLMLLGLLNGACSAKLVGVAECTVAGLQQLAPADTTITAASVVEASRKIPPYCQVDASVATPANTVNFRLGLPATWNGKFYFQGVGGFAGSIGSLEEPAQATGASTPGLQRGYASATTDTGHQGSSTDARWALNNRAKEIDYGYRGTHVTVVAAKSVTRAYYGTAPRYAYFNGCSSGGRQALMEAQRYPEDFDGLIAGAPAFGTLPRIKETLMYQAMLSSPERFLPAAKLELVSKAVLGSCDASDGVADGLITDPRDCRFRPETLKCADADSPNCLTAGQMDTLKTIYADVRSPLEDQIIYGFPVGHEVGPTGWQSRMMGASIPVLQPDGTLAFGSDPPPDFRFQDDFLRYLAFEVDDPAFDWRTFDLKRHGPKLEFISKILNPTDPDLTKLQERGGKLILYHGWADPGLSAYGTVGYYDKVVKAVGGQQKADAFVRLFMVPGMHHCADGPGPNTFDMMLALENWVERGVAPARVIASHTTNGVVDRTRPLCPHPQVARYVGGGSIDAAENFRCEAPRLVSWVGGRRHAAYNLLPLPSQAWRYTPAPAWVC